MTKLPTRQGSAGQTVRDIRRATRQQHKIRIVLEGLRGETLYAIEVRSAKHGTT